MIARNIARHSTRVSDGCEWCKEVNGFMKLDMLRCSTCDLAGEEHNVEITFTHCPHCGRAIPKGGE
jgi:hypothetical protein